jgi:hypothetical protein
VLYSWDIISPSGDKEGHVVDPIYTGELDVFTVIKVKDEPPKS